MADTSLPNQRYCFKIFIAAITYYPILLLVSMFLLDFLFLKKKKGLRGSEF